MECERDSTDPGLDDMGGGKRRRIETSDDHQDHGAGPSASLPVPNAEGTSEQDGSLNGHSDDAAAALESSDDEMEGRGVSEVIHRLKSQVSSGAVRYSVHFDAVNAANSRTPTRWKFLFSLVSSER